MVTSLLGLGACHDLPTAAGHGFAGRLRCHAGCYLLYVRFQGQLISLQEEVLTSQRHVIGGLTDIGAQQREVLASAAQLWQVCYAACY